MESHAWKNSNSKQSNRGLQISNQMCTLCNKDVELVDHLLLHCEFTEVHFWIFKWCGITVRGFSSVTGFLITSTIRDNCQRKKVIGDVILFGVLWYIWFARKDKIFKNIRVVPPKVTDDIISNSYSWCKHRSHLNSGGWVEWSYSSFAQIFPKIFKNIRVVSPMFSLSSYL